MVLAGRRYPVPDRYSTIRKSNNTRVYPDGTGLMPDTADVVLDDGQVEQRPAAELSTDLGFTAEHSWRDHVSP